eukprot:m.102931 g.102931  ORF g.102931 m.102931 type:complete len:221 (-) comp15204_c0_seq2:188-850(-)
MIGASSPNTPIRQSSSSQLVCDLLKTCFTSVSCQISSQYAMLLKLGACGSSLFTLRLLAGGAMARLHHEQPNVFFIVVGPVLDKAYAADVQSTALEWPNVCVLDAVPQAELHHMMAAATAVVNSSVSEGVCGVLLESMLLGVPVVGRRNAGNSALIQHEVNGLLYDTPTEGIAQCLRLLTDLALRKKLIQQAANDVRMQYSRSSEADGYTSVIKSLDESS